MADADALLDAAIARDYGIRFTADGLVEVPADEPDRSRTIRQLACLAGAATRRNDGDG